MQRFSPAGMDGGQGARDGATVTGLPTRQANAAPKSDTPTSDSTKSMRMTIAMDPANPGQQKFEDGGILQKLFCSTQRPQWKGAGRTGLVCSGRNKGQEERVFRRRVHKKQNNRKNRVGVQSTAGKPLYEIPRTGLIKDRVGPLARPGRGTTGTIIKDQRWYLQRGTEHKYFLPRVFRQTTVANPDGTVTNTLAPTSVPW
jgi:hypothetical protein